MVYGYLKDKIGTAVSYAVVMCSCLFPLTSSAKDHIAATQQLERSLVKVLEAELQHWQRQAGLESIKKTIQVNLPSGAANLQQCPNEVYIATGSRLPFGNVQRRATCDALGWSLFIRARVDVTANVPVANRPLARGEQISATDIELQWLKLSASDRDLITKKSQLIGNQVSHKVRRFRAIKASQVTNPQWINIGDRVVIEARMNGFYANMPGEALESGGKGSTIRVRNLSSGKIIHVYPTEKGRVTTLF
ncbi:flagellar basal body P-ring formation chaperone FlgA [Shewanella sp. 10N.7]|uniref:flagellar basal body P-ring formation chaperone FlgA n=1 Tax=Shewanella sp. 10N.7 TaxID=2885093 RepID=UPI001E4AB907|nr:flagellar basal body P-ring formation chaperone FlgA [Shewanella sp. 10N.7]MCC4834389.1 flagellar basal body P-ring formation chaperone FlgA [Shewanella sp. 10N.7]